MEVLVRIRFLYLFSWRIFREAGEGPGRHGIRTQRIKSLLSASQSFSASGSGRARPYSTANRAWNSCRLTRMRASGMPAIGLLLAEMSLARRTLSASARPARMRPFINRGWDGLQSVNRLVAGSSWKTTCTSEVGAPVMDEWIFVISAANAAFVWTARVLAAVMQV